MFKFTILATVALFAVAATAKSHRTVPSASELLLGNRFAGLEAHSQYDTTFAEEYDVEIHTVTQRVDNFDLQNRDTFEQRFMSRSTFYQAGGPIIIVVGGFYSLWPGQLNYTMAAHIAQQSNAILFNLEHRYFGESSFTNDSSAEAKRLLTPDQALADIAHFIAYIRANETILPSEARDARILLNGEEYGGTLAVWFRQKYPHLAHAAWASSAPVLAQPSNAEYKELAGETFLEMAGQECYDALDNGFKQLGELADARQWAELEQHFNTCTPIGSDADISYLFVSVAEYFTSFSTFRPLTNYLCGRLLNETNATPVDALKFAMGINQYPYCYDVDYQAFIELMSDEIAVRYNYRDRMFLECTQLGGFQTSESPNHPYGSHYPIAFFNQMCTDIFGDSVTGERLQLAADRLNVVYGGLEPRVTNVLLSFGDQDSGRSLQIRESVEDAIEVLEIAEAARSYDFYVPDLEYDSEATLAAKQRIVEVVTGWLE